MKFPSSGGVAKNPGFFDGVVKVAIFHDLFLTKEALKSISSKLFEIVSLFLNWVRRPPVCSQ
ncbi:MULTISPECIES: hypothetical protein [Chryseobacterium]|uniref:hypothetical protein n=1 Tax=Chryseobacterium TaxID=59732 RepID=UPI001032F584|nr:MULTISPECIES: hypothetical protein [Chryseobacterium]QQV01414.1 hypothetical protein I6I61_09880 [Chryseobacterium sp. FDAARGOS 1104]